jgi:hypothetical protein
MSGGKRVGKIDPVYAKATPGTVRHKKAQPSYFAILAK